MIGYLRGNVRDKSAEQVLLDVGGVGYLVAVSSDTERRLPPVGGTMELYIHMHGSQDAPPQLFGFADDDERRLFQVLLAVQGVGPKVALAILSGLPASQLVTAIATSDVARLTQIRGIGRKTAERMTVELREKIGAFGTTRVSAPVVSSKPVLAGNLPEVHGALLSLGYRPGEFEDILAEMDPGTAAAVLIKQALAALQRR